MSKPPVELDPISFSEMNVKQLKLHLMSQLHDNETILGKSGTSQITRNALIKQAEILRKQLLDLSQFDEEADLPSEFKSKFESQYMPSNDKYVYSSLLPPAPSNSTPSKHRTKNVNGTTVRKPDADFATEIGQGLLNEIRKLQIALQDKESMIRQLELSKSDNEKTTESIQHTLKQRQEIEDKLKEEIWNLEVANQELQTNLSESNQLVSKHSLEFSKLTKKLKAQAEQIDIMKAQEEKSNSVIEAMKARHEQEIYNLRRQAAAGQRETAQIKKEVETLNTELKICKAKLAVKLAATARVTEEIVSPEAEHPEPTTLDDSDSIPYVSPPPQPSSRNQALETETLKQSLAHAHRIISNLRSSLHKEKMEKFEVKKMLTDSQENIEQLRKKLANSSSVSVMRVGKKKGVSRVGVARKAKGLCANDSDTDKPTTDNEKSDIEDNEISDDDDEEYMDPEFSLEGMFGSIIMPSTTIKSLSSELEENKVQVIDTGVNTDSFELLLETEKQKALEDMIPKAQVEKMVDELNREQLEKNANLRSSIETELKQDMMPNTEVNVLLESITQKAQQEVEKAISDIKQSEKELKIKVEQELKKDMILRADVDTLIEEAVQSTKLELAKSEEALRRDIENELMENMMYKSEVDIMMQQKTAEEPNQEITIEQKEQLKLSIENELLQNMVPKSQVDSLIEDAQQEMRNEIQSMISVATQPLEQEIAQYKQQITDATTKEEKIREETKEALQNQKSELEKVYIQNLEKQKLEMEEVKKAEFSKFALELELKKKSELEGQRIELEQAAKTDLESQKQELYNTTKHELEKQLKELNDAKNAEISALTKRQDTLQKDYSDLKQKMLDMLTKDSVDVLIKRAVTEAVEQAEKKHAEVLSGMISKEYSDRLVADSVEKALEQQEQNTVAHMISKAEAEALAKIAAADAVIKERQDAAVREKELLTKEEADFMVQSAVKEAIDKFKNERVKERMSLKEHNTPSEVTKISIPIDQTFDGPLETPLPTQEQVLVDDLPVIERSISASKLSQPSINISLSPSVSTPVGSSRKLRLISSVQSFRNKMEKPSTDSNKESVSFGSVRVLETSNYGATHLAAKTLSKKQSLTMSVSTMSSNEDAVSRMPMFMHSIEGLSSFVGSGIDAQIISAITQTMIGEWMSKHTRRYVGGGISEKKHQRFFWVHPYTKTLYWSSMQPGTEGSEGKTKSALIGSVTAVSSGNSASPMSLLIRSPRRSIKVTASSAERHELWLKSLTYLLGRNSKDNSLEEETIASSFVEQRSLKTKPSNATFLSEAQLTQYDSDDSEEVATSIRQHKPAVSA